MPIMLDDLQTTIKITVSEYGEYELGWISLGSISFLSSLDKTLPAREFCVVILQHLLVSPELPVEAVRALPNKALAKLLREWSKSQAGLAHPLPSRASVFTAFQSAMLAYVAEQYKSISELSNRIIASYGSALSVVNVGASVRALINSSSWNAISKADAYSSLISSVSRGFSGIDTSLINGAMTSVAESVSALVKAIDITPLIGDLQKQIAALNVGRVWAAQSQMNLNAIIDAVNTQGVARDMSHLLAHSLQASSAFGKYYQGVVDSASRLTLPESLLTRNIVVPPLTTAALLNTVRQVGFTASPADDGDDATEMFISPGQTNVGISIEGYLSSVRPGLVAVWQGSWQALYSSNPDKYRQAAHSGRELISQILHILAPDESFTAQEIAQRGRDGKPTRKMRIARIMGRKAKSTEVEYVESLARTLDSLYSCLSARAHDHGDEISGTEISGYLMTLKGMIILLLADL